MVNGTLGCLLKQFYLRFVGKRPQLPPEVICELEYWVLIIHLFYCTKDKIGLNFCHYCIFGFNMINKSKKGTDWLKKLKENQVFIMGYIL